MDAIPITGDGIKLGQFLKLANLVDQGSDAKVLLAGGRVAVNGEVDMRRGRQLVRGDTVTVDDMVFGVGDDGAS
jgi:ribosome-associated protein